MHVDLVFVYTLKTISDKQLVTVGSQPFPCVKMHLQSYVFYIKYTIYCNGFLKTECIFIYNKIPNKQQ